MRLGGGRRAECGVSSVHCAVRSVECGVRSAECGVRCAPATNTSQFTFLLLLMTLSLVIFALSSPVSK
jgi:hypothetical protein